MIIRLLRIYLAIAFVPIISLIVFVLVVNILQNKRPDWLPLVLRNWLFLPEYLRSLKPYDNILVKCVLCCKNLRLQSNTSDNEIKTKQAKFEREMNNQIELAAYENKSFVEVQI